MAPEWPGSSKAEAKAAGWLGPFFTIVLTLAAVPPVLARQLATSTNVVFTHTHTVALCER